MSNKTYTVNVLTTDMKRVEYVEIGSIHSIFQHLRTKLNMLGVSSIIKVIVKPLKVGGVDVGSKTSHL